MDGAASGSTSTNAASERTPASGSADPPDESRLGERLRAVERAITGTEHSVANVSDGATAAAEREELTDRLDDVEARVEELEAATQALRGYTGSIRAVNREVERRADLALARASEADGSAADPATGPKESRHGSGAEVPSEDALDAAVPSEPSRRADHGSAVSGGSSGRSGEANDGARTDPNDDRSEDGSWPSDTLDRLRESL